MFRSWILILLGIQELTTNECSLIVFGFMAHRSHVSRSYHRLGRPEVPDRTHGLSHLSHNEFFPSLKFGALDGFENGPLSTSFQNIVLTKFAPSSSISISDAEIGDLPSIVVIPGVLLLGAISAFVFANLVYTPEILENAEQIRLETRDEEIRSVLDAVRQHVQEGKDLEELRRPLEVALNMSVEKYVQAVTAEKNSSNDESADRSTEFTEADVGLASILASKMKSLVNDD
jgi:hypothetical protein